jgi:hypothetical protein
VCVENGLPLTATRNCVTIGARLAKRGTWANDKEGTMKNPKIRKMIGSFVIELIIYSVLVVAYFFAVLRLLGDPLYRLYSSNLMFYAFLALALIVAQAVVLEAVTAFIMGLLGLDQLE